MKYKVKTVEIEAEQWFPSGGHIEGVYLADFYSPVVDTPEGTVGISAGDWVITSTDGNKYVCRKDDFKNIYEEVEIEEVCICSYKNLTLGNHRFDCPKFKKL